MNCPEYRSQKTVGLIHELPRETETKYRIQL